jgi:predicted NAD-dependent protein-ADP-ribosyltransferase YbiA (DUF1768 family)
MNRLAYYEHSTELEDEDIGRDVPIYSVDIFNQDYLITIGNERKMSSKKNTYYVPVYLMNKDTKMVEKQIGLYEFESSEKEQKNRLLPFLDKNGDINPVGLGDLLLYSHSNIDFFEASTLQITQGDIAILEDEYSSTTLNKPIDNHTVEEEVDITEDIFHIEIPNSNSNKQSISKQNIFKMDSAIQIPATLVEETKEDAKNMKLDFKPNKQNRWIENFMKNNQYDIVETSDNGDCFFDSIRQAYLQQGLHTTIGDLRALVASEVDESIFDHYKHLFKEFDTVHSEILHETEQLRKEFNSIKRRLDAISNDPKSVSEKNTIELRIRDITERNRELKEMFATNKEIYDDFAFMKRIETLDQLRDYIKTSQYWADEWSIGVIERKLGLKCIIFAEYNYKEGDLNWILQSKQPKKDNVFQCTTSEVINPEYYVLLNYTSKHYEIISYKQKYMFSFSEIPYDVKIMVVIKCMEGPSVYNQIQNFRNFQSKMGITVRPLNEEEETEPADVLENVAYDPDVVLMFYNKSANTVGPGKGNGESISVEKSSLYKELGLKKWQGWRRKMDDEWPIEFTLDGHQWQTVEHYYQASKFRKMHPEFYKTFTLDKGTEEISKHVEMARIAGSKTGSKGKITLRPQNIKVDPDFYGGRNVEEREKAIYAKFTQNDELKKILLMTRNAKLLHYVPKKESELDIVLMRVRRKIREESGNRLLE